MALQNENAKTKKQNCNFYQKNICEFGISGKGCQYFHQKPCSKLLQKGICQMEGRCPFFHPPMCKFSLNRRLCTNLKCNFMHVRGTKRASSSKKETTVKPAVKSPKQRKESRSTYSGHTFSNVVKNNLKDGSKSTTEKQNADFLGSGQKSPNPPLLVPALGNGSGEEMKILLSLMSQLVQILQPSGIQTNQVQMPQQVRVQAQPLHQLLVPQQSHHTVLHLGQ